MKWELFFQEIIQGKRKGLWLPLKLLSFPYACIVFCRNWAYDRGWLSQYTAPIPVVVSIGNITVGGTGKTPLTVLFAKNFEGQYKVAITSRGYRSKAEKGKKPLVVSKSSAAAFGDEPTLLAESLPKVVVYSGRNRVAAAHMAAKSGTQLLVLDDGLQHRQLARDIDIVVLDGRHPFGTGNYLPLGSLRDSIKSLSRAHFLVFNHVKDMDHLNQLKAMVKPYSRAPQIGVKTVVHGIYDLLGNSVSLSPGQKVGIFCGIAKPDDFFQTVKGLGVEIVDHVYFPDHTLGDLSKFEALCRSKGANILLCTEKDKVKLDKHLSVYWVKIKMEIIDENHHWDHLIDSIKKKLAI